MEILDICDELGNPTGKTVEREIAHQQGILHRTAHVWILRKKENKKERWKNGGRDCGRGLWLG